MLIFIRNTPRAYAWGSTDALPNMLGTVPTGEPQAELWLGDHPGNPATIAKASAAPLTLIELIESDPDLYGVDGGSLPFLLKVLAIGAPLSLQAHPNLAQARAGFAAENAAGVPLDAPERNYRDANHKPEMLVALSEVTALSGFRPLADAEADLRAIAMATGIPALALAADRLRVATPEAARRDYLEWAFGGSPDVAAALDGLTRALRPTSAGADVLNTVDVDRADCLRALAEHHPGDPGLLVSLLLHHVRLKPGEAVFLGAQQLHAYLSGIAVEVMATSDNVLRAGLTSKHIDVAETLNVLDLTELEDPRFAGRRIAQGLCAWAPDVPDFKLLRARVRDVNLDDDELLASNGSGNSEPSFARCANVMLETAAEEILVDTVKPLVLIATQGRIRVSRPDGELSEMVNVARGQSLYISAGEPIRITGTGEAFLATVGEVNTGASSGSDTSGPRTH